MRLFVGVLLAACLALPPAAASAQQLDSAVATGSSLSFQSIDIHAQSGPSGENPSGHMSFALFGTEVASGPVTCLNVQGNDAVLNADTEFGVVTVELVDNGGDGNDTMSAIGGRRTATDCSPFNNSGLTEKLTNGRAIVVDAQPLPTSTRECRDGGFANFGFKSEGRCITFVVLTRICDALAKHGITPSVCPPTPPARSGSWR